MRFEDLAAHRIQTLEFDMKSVRPQAVIEQVMSGSPKSFDLPLLRTLMVTMDQSETHLEFIFKFMGPAITTFIAELWEPCRPPERRGWPALRDMLSAYDRAVRNEDEPCDYSSTVESRLYSHIQQRMPHLEHLVVFVSKTLNGHRGSGDLADVVLSLKKLRFLALDPLIFTPQFYDAISSHRSLTHTKAWGDDLPRRGYLTKHLRIKVPSSLLPAVSLPPFLGRLTNIVLSSTFTSLMSCLSRTEGSLSSVRKLHVYLSKPADHNDVMTDLNLGNLFSLAARLFPSVKDMKVERAPHNPEQWALDFYALEPLCAYSSLQSLSIGSTRRIASLDRQKFAKLVSNWPSLRRFILDYQPNPEGELVYDPALQDVLPLGDALSILRTHCPHLEYASIAVSPNISSQEAAREPFLCLQGLELAVVPTPKKTPAPELATFLDGICPPGCRLRITAVQEGDTEEAGWSDITHAEAADIFPEKSLWTAWSLLRPSRWTSYDEQLNFEDALQPLEIVLREKGMFATCSTW